MALGPNMVLAVGHPGFPLTIIVPTDPAVATVGDPGFPLGRWLGSRSRGPERQCL